MFNIYAHILKKNKKVAFTLAEVLITLGIIGVVAAMTIPNLIANTNGQKFRVQFKKTLSTLNQANRMSQAQYDWNFNDINAVDGRSDGYCCSAHPETDMSMCALMNGTLTGMTCHTNSSGPIDDYNPTMVTFTPGSNWFDQYWYSLADGSLVSFNGGTCEVNGHPWGCQGIIDVNGISKPNKEVTCSIETTKYIWDANNKPCIVKNSANNMTDIFPIVYTKEGVVPATNAGAYVLQSAK